MNKVILSLLAASVIVYASCNKSSSSATPQAQVMFYNGYLVTTPLNVTANATVVTNGTSLQFLKATGYQNITAGTAQDVAFVLASTNSKIADTTVTFGASTKYSVFVTGLITAPAMVVTSDDLSAPTSGNAKVRFVNLSPDTLSDNVYAGTTQIATGIKYRGVTPFVQVPVASAATLLVQDPNHVPFQTSLTNQNISAGKIYTIVLTGEVSGTGSAKNTITLLNNN